MSGCLCLPVGWRLLLCPGLPKPCSSHPSLAQGPPSSCPVGIATHVTARSHLTRVPRVRTGHGSFAAAHPQVLPTKYGKKQLLFTFVKAAATAAIKCWSHHNMRLFHGFPSPSGMGKSLFDILVWNSFVQYRQSYLPVIVLPKNVRSRSLSCLLPWFSLQNNVVPQAREKL